MANMSEVVYEQVKNFDSLGRYPFPRAIVSYRACAGEHCPGSAC